MKDSDKIKLETEIDHLLIFIGDHIKAISDIKGEKLKDLAKLCGVDQENLSRYKKYGESVKDGESKDPHIRTFYKILKGILGRPPISLNDPQDLKIRRFTSAQERDVFGILDKIIILLHSGLDLAELSDIINIFCRRLDVSPKKTGEGP